MKLKLFHLTLAIFSEKPMRTIIASALLAIFFFAMPLSAEEKVNTVKIGVVDESRLLDEYEKSVQLIGLLEERFNEEKMNITKLQQKMKKLKEKIQSDIYPEAKREEFVDQLHKSEIEAKIKQEVVSAEINRKREFYTMQVYKDMLEAIKLFGEKKGYDLILRKNLPKMRRDLDAQNIVLFNKKEADITEKVLDLMNAKYREENRDNQNRQAQLDQ